MDIKNQSVIIKKNNKNYIKLKTSNEVYFFMKIFLKESWKFSKWFIFSKLISKKFEDFFQKKNAQKKIIINENPLPCFLVDYRHNLNIRLLKCHRDEIVFETNQLSLPHANSLRRILLGELKIAAIQDVFFYQNTSVLNDENVAHRLGLIPIFVNSEFLNKTKDDISNKLEKIILDFKLKNPKNSFKVLSIYSRSLKLKKYGLFFSLNKNLTINPVFRDILILKLNPGQKIKCECHCIINSGIKHAKFSPVGTAFYRISPKIKIVGEVLGKYANKLYEVCPVKVFDIKDAKKNYLNRLKVSNPQFCTLCKECLRINIGRLGQIRLSRIKNKLTFVIESTGVLSPEVLFHRAVGLLVGKCNQSLSILFKSFEW